MKLALLFKDHKDIRERKDIRVYINSLPVGIVSHSPRDYTHKATP